MKTVQAAKAKFTSYDHLPTNRCSKSRQCVKLWITESQIKQGVGDSNSEQDICIPSIYVKVVTLDLNPSMQTNK